MVVIVVVTLTVVEAVSTSGTYVIVVGGGVT